MANSSRRDFITGSVLAGAALATGCQGSRFGFGAGGSMAGFRVAPMDRIRVGIVGCGGRGGGGARRFRQFGCVEVTALCDIKQGQIDKCQKTLAEKGLPKAREFLGPEAYKALCDSGLCDVVYNTTPIELHRPVAVKAMESGLHVLTEVELTNTLEGNWELVETAERTRRHCMMLENCCYGEDELLMFSLAKAGKLGDVMHGEAGYIHDCRSLMFPKKLGDEEPWRTMFISGKRKPGNDYPTHGLGPLAQAMDVNRGDRFDYLVSITSRAAGYKAFAEEKFGKDSVYGKRDYIAGDMNTSIIRTVKGNTIMLQFNESTPRPYTRMNLLQGTKGIIRTYPLRVAWAENHVDGANQFFVPEKLEEVKRQYGSPLWKKLGEYAKGQGHGGMDFIMDARWIYCLHEGLPLDIDVYDSATWSVLAGLTEESVNRRGAPVDIPDFTRGGWRSARPLGIPDIDIAKLGFTGTATGNESEYQKL